MRIDVKRAEAAQGRLGKHIAAGQEIRETAESVASLHHLPDANPAQTFASHLKDLAERMKTLLDTAAKNATAADNSPVFDSDLKNLRGALGWTPPIAYSTRTVSVAFDERVPDLEPGQFYLNDDNHKDGADREKELWGPDGVPSVEDINQGDFGDCWLLAVLNSMAATNPDRVKALITDHGDGTYTVHLATGDVVVTDSALPNTNRVNSKSLTNQKWVRLVEYAYAQYMGTYQRIDGGYGTDGMKVIFGLDSEHFDPNKTIFSYPLELPKDPDKAFDAMENALKNKLPVTVTVRNEAYGFSAHELAVTGFVTVNGVRYAKVRNPWGYWDDSTKLQTWMDGGAKHDTSDLGTLWVPAGLLADACSQAAVGK